MAKLVEIKTESDGINYMQVAYFEGAPSAVELMQARGKAKALDNPPGVTGMNANTISTPKLRSTLLSKEANQERWVLGYTREEDKD